MERPYAHTLRFSMVARANVAYDRLLAVVLCVLATCSSCGDTEVREKSAESAQLRAREREVIAGGRDGARVCGRVVELVREADGMRRAAPGVYVA